VSTVKTNNVQIGQSVTATNNFTWYQPASPDGTVRLGNGNSGSVTDLVTLTSAGNLGIGTSSPAQVLDVQKAQAWVTATSTTGTNSSVFKTANTGGSSYFGRESSAGTVFGGGAYATVVYGSGAYPMSFFTNDTKQMTLDSSGNLGIGVTPSYKLDVNGYLRAGGTSPNASGINVFNSQQYVYTTANWNYSNLNLIRPSTNTSTPRFLSFMLDGDSEASTTIGGYPAIWGVYSGTPTTGSTSSGLSAKMGLASYAGFNYYINGTQAMTLDASGNLLVGLTGSAGSAYTLQVKGAFNFTNSSGNQVCSYEPSNGYLYMAPIYNKTTASAANVYVGSAPGDMYRSTSALKYKQDIRDLESIDINKFRPVRYRSKCENDDQSKDHFGIIADEALEAGFPELVIFGADGEPEGFQYERLTVVLVKAVQNLSAELNLLKQKVNA